MAGVAGAELEPPDLRKLGRQIAPEMLERRAVRLLERLEGLLLALAFLRRFDDHADQQVSWFNHRVVAVLQHRDPPHRAGEALLYLAVNLLFDVADRRLVHGRLRVSYMRNSS